jgi:hypothetical protein
MNPGTGPIDSRCLARTAWKNIRAFRRDLAFKDPTVTIERSAENDDGQGRYGFTLKRGKRECDVEMPGLDIRRVRYVSQDQNPFNFPRLYVDGSSWLWEFAISNARSALFDHDKSIERRVAREEKACERELKKQPTCSTCGSFREAKHHWNREDPAQEGYTVVCYECEPDITDSVRDKGFGRYKVKLRRMPIGGPKVCNRRIGFSGSMCRLAVGHEGMCEGYWTVVEWGERV